MADKPNTTNLPTRFQKAKPIGTVRMPEPLPDGVTPESCYAMAPVGDCFEPLIIEGMRVVVTSDLHPVADDFAVIYLKEVEQPLLKRMWMVPPREMMKVSPKSEVMPLVIAEQFNPPRRYKFPVDRVEAIHPVIGFVLVGSDTAIPVDKFLASKRVA